VSATSPVRRCEYLDPYAVVEIPVLRCDVTSVIVVTHAHVRELGVVSF